MPKREPENAGDKAGGKGRASQRSEQEHDDGCRARKRARCKGHSLAPPGREQGLLRKG